MKPIECCPIPNFERPTMSFEVKVRIRALPTKMQKDPRLHKRNRALAPIEAKIVTTALAMKILPRVYLGGGRHLF